jgi:hypothetical protein
MAWKLRRNQVLLSGIRISKRFQKNEDTERCSHPETNSADEKLKKCGIILVWNTVIQTRQDSHPDLLCRNTAVMWPEL